MNPIKKVSDIHNTDVAEYLRIALPTPDELKFLDTALISAKSFICGYTGLTREELDDYEDLVMVIYVLCQTMFDDRTFYADTNNLNVVIQNTLNMHSRNLI